MAVRTIPTYTYIFFINLSYNFLSFSYNFFFFSSFLIIMCFDKFKFIPFLILISFFVLRFKYSDPRHSNQKQHQHSHPHPHQHQGSRDEKVRQIRHWHKEFALYSYSEYYAGFLKHFFLKFRIFL